jgi:hypothetical protein
MHAQADHTELGKLHPLARIGEVSDVVDAVLYLQRATFVTGENIHRSLVPEGNQMKNETGWMASLRLRTSSAFEHRAETRATFPRVALTLGTLSRRLCLSQRRNERYFFLKTIYLSDRVPKYRTRTRPNFNHVAFVAPLREAQTLHRCERVLDCDCGNWNKINRLLPSLLLTNLETEA